MSGCLKIIPKTSQSNYIRIQSSESGCFSNHLGMEGIGMQKVNIENPGCTRTGTIVHEFIHALGFWHEHVRPDRDNYVRILWDNIKPGPGPKWQFEKQTHSLLFGSYDGKSVMHYGSKGFSKND